MSTWQFLEKPLLPPFFSFVLNNSMLFFLSRWHLSASCKPHIHRLGPTGWSWKSAVGVTGNSTVMIYYVKGDTCSLYTILKVQKRASGGKLVLLLCPRPPLALFFLRFIYFIFWLRWVVIAVLGLSAVAVSGGYSSLVATLHLLGVGSLLLSTGSRYTGFSHCSVGTVAVAHSLGCMWDLPGPGVEPVSLELQGQFLTTEPLGNPDTVVLKEIL